MSAISFFGDGEFTPIDPQRIFALAQGDVVGIPIRVDGAKPPIPVADGELLELPGGFYPGQPLVQRGCDSGLQTKMKLKSWRSKRSQKGC